MRTKRSLLSGVLRYLPILALIFCTLPCLLAQEKAKDILSPISEKTRNEWYARYDRAQAKRTSGLIFAIGATVPLAFGAWDYSRRFDEVSIPGSSYDVIRCSGGVCVDTVVREASTISKVENSGRRNLAIVELVGGGALFIWGLVRAQTGAAEMRELEDQRRKWGTIGFAPVGTGRGWMICYQKTF